MPRKYQHMQLRLPLIKEMLQQGMTQKIEKILGLTGDRPVHHLLKREKNVRIGVEKPMDIVELIYG